MLRRETSLKALHGNIPARLKIRFSLWKFSFGWASLHIWQLPPPSPLPRTLLIFQKKGVWSSAAPPSSPLQATSETSAKSLPHRLRARPDVLSSLSVHLQAVGPGTSSSLCHCQADTHLIPGLRKATGKCSLPALTGLTGWVKVEIGEGLQKDTPAGDLGSEYFPAARFCMVSPVQFQENME